MKKKMKKAENAKKSIKETEMKNKVGKASLKK